ncbi:MAG: phosphatidylglycerophosphate synthase [Candidatus Pseudothioglobus sp.]|jgi:phosphatidylglycerophosphate synthase
MIDAELRRWIDPPLNKAGNNLSLHGVTANQITLLGFSLGIIAMVCIALQYYLPGLALILLNRLCDGLDGAIARASSITDLGGYLDIVLDFIFYSAIVFGFVLAQPDHATAGAFLIFSFIGSGTSFLAYSTFAAKRGLTTNLRGKKSLYYLGGLTEGFETITCLVMMCLYPDAFWIFAVGFGGLCWLTTLERLCTAVRTL